MNEEATRQLKKFPFFRDLPDETLLALSQKVSARRIARDDVLMRKGDEGDSLFMILDGWVKIVTEDSAGDELIINQCGPGETIGEMALIDQSPRSATAIALDEAEVLELRQDAFLEILNEWPDLSMALIRSIASRLRFSTIYIQKAIEWSRRTAAGDYSFIEHTPPIMKRTGSDDDKAGQLLFAFFQMVHRVKEREEGLKRQLDKLAFEIDHARRKQAFEDITSTEFYSKLKEQAKKLRAQRDQDDSREAK